MDSGSSCVTLDKLFNLSELPAYSSVSQYVHLVYTVHISAHCSFTKHFCYLSAFDSCNNPVKLTGAYQPHFIKLERKPGG